MSNKPATIARRRAQPGFCPTCGELVIGGLDDNIAASHSHADPIPVTWAGELAARLHQQRRSFIWQRQELTFRYLGCLVTECQYPVVIEHICGQPIPEHWKAPTPVIPTDGGIDETTAPPF